MNLEELTQNVGKFELNNKREHNEIIEELKKHQHAVDENLSKRVEELETARRVQIKLNERFLKFLDEEKEEVKKVEDKKSFWDYFR